MREEDKAIIIKALKRLEELQKTSQYPFNILYSVLYKEVMGIII